MRTLLSVGDDRSPPDPRMNPGSPTGLRGGMQAWPLRVSTILDHAARFHGRQEVVTRTVEDGAIRRDTYADVARRARQCAAALERAGARVGDRIGTLAW